MANPLFVLLLSSSLLFLSPLAYSNPNHSTSPPPSAAHAELNKYGFPAGLLPINVVGYAVNETSSDFFVSLDDPCKVTLPPDNYLAAYSSRITGKIVAGRITQLDGIRVRAFFQWWPITGIKSNGDYLFFDIGMITTKYPSKDFDESPQCLGKRFDS
ncbi:Protein of unknown function DUF538 protein [Actinidia chinensis var. chinensis]|uniref:DUF538 family protein n=2 Tax=Actinidia TaxID=3624 RepID=A0A7J0FCB3_9ERIC|nr:Protein of unknown function DUF538 protein [Actinidia chinensis var. chinensis]GFY96315.1 DUF538 family protein [Actinidia rufa]